MPDPAALRGGLPAATPPPGGKSVRLSSLLQALRVRPPPHSQLLCGHPVGTPALAGWLNMNSSRQGPSCPWGKWGDAGDREQQWSKDAWLTEPRLPNAPPRVHSAQVPPFHRRGPAGVGVGGEDAGGHSCPQQLPGLGLPGLRLLHPTSALTTSRPGTVGGLWGEGRPYPRPGRVRSITWVSGPVSTPEEGGVCTGQTPLPLGNRVSRWDRHGAAAGRQNYSVC